MDWALTREHDPATGITLLAELEWPEILTTPQEALRWYERAAQETDAMPSAVAHARILRHCVLLQWVVGRPLAERQRTAEREVEIAKMSGDPNEVSRALANLGACYQRSERFAEAEIAFQEAYARPQLLTRLTRNAVMRSWATTDVQRGNFESARQRFLEVERTARPGSEAHASALLNLAEAQYSIKNVEAAREAAQRARETYTLVGSAYLVLALSNLAAYALAADDLQDARERLREALVAGQSGRWLVSIIEHHALLAALQGDCERAALLLGFTDARYHARGEARPMTEQRGYERLVTELARNYEDGELERLTRAGANMSEEEVLTAAAAISGAT